MAVTIPTVDALQAVAIAEVQSRNPRLTDITEGSVIDAVTGAGALMADESIRITLQGQAEHFLGTAQGAALDALAADRGFPPRVAASPSQGLVTWTKDLPAAAYVVPAGATVRGTLDDGTPVDVVTVSAFSILAIDTTVQIPAVSVLTGLDQNLAIGFLDTIVDIQPADPGATATNAARFVGGAPAETDAAYRDRLRLFFTTLRRGTVEALIFGALSVPGVSIATVDESTVPVDGIVRVYIGDPDAQSNQALIDAVALELENYRAAGVQVQVFGSTREEIDVALTVTVPAGTDQVALAVLIRANILAYTDVLQPAEALRVSELDFRAHDASDLVISVVSTDPTADVSPSAPQNAIRVNSVDITLTFVEI